MNKLQDFWNKNSARIPDDKGESLYAIEKEKLFPRASRVCDLGGGTGTDSIYFASKGHDVVLVDIADEPLSKANIKAEQADLKHKITTQQCDFTGGTIPLPSDSYDVVYSRLALHYFESAILSQIVAEIYRILKDGGSTYLTLKSPDDKAEMKYLATTAKEVEDGVFDEEGRIKTRYTIERLSKIISDAGVPSEQVQVHAVTEKLGNENDIVKSGNASFIVNEIIISK